MNTAQAKKIPLQEILARLGFQPVKRFKGGEELAYRSPFRDEKEPSLFVNVRKNVWNDFGETGGNALDFVMRYRNTDVRGALEFMGQMFGGGFMPVSQPAKAQSAEETPKESTFLLASTAPLGESARSLLEYVTQERRISPEIAAKHLKEVRFSNRQNGRNYFAAGFANLSGGYEIRNPFFKSSLGPKDMSLVKGSGGGREVWVFEGFMDFLSKLTLDAALEISADALVLNSASYAEKALNLVRETGYASIKGYLDNDRAGDDVTGKFRAEFGDAFTDMRHEFRAFKDLNEFLKSA